MSTDVDLGFRERAMMEIPGARLGTRCTQLRVPLVEDPYMLLAIQYMIIITGSRRRQSCIYIVSIAILPLYCLSIACPPRSTPAWLYICNQAKVYKSPNLLHIRVAFLDLLHDGPSLVW